MNYKSFFKLSYGLYVVSTSIDGRKNGYVANTAFQVTAEPAQVAISCNKDNLSSELIEKSGLFSISVLKQEASSDLIGQFGYKTGKDIKKFENVEHFIAESGTPVVTQDCIAWFDCKVVQKVDVGSHILFIGEILDCDVLDEDAEPLTYDYYHKVKKAFSPKNAPTYIDESKLEAEEEKPKEGKKYRCLACGYIYSEADGDPHSGIEAGTKFEDLPDDWTCPACGATKDMFEEI